ncbi:hypothetical protein GQ53DRAFT_336797 [Thozetella sp. PMI_491]|nr:hypothetical protein GQ53DRAFT_336797 [Thozetella sp. PMI_491]
MKSCLSCWAKMCCRRLKGGREGGARQGRVRLGRPRYRLIWGRATSRLVKTGRPAIAKTARARLRGRPPSGWTPRGRPLAERSWGFWAFVASSQAPLDRLGEVAPQALCLPRDCPDCPGFLARRPRSQRCIGGNYPSAALEQTRGSCLPYPWRRLPSACRGR